MWLRQSCLWTAGVSSRFVAPPRQTIATLLISFSPRAGVAMEDAHPTAVIDEGAFTLASWIAAVQQAGATILALAGAAERLWHSSSRATNSDPS
jgi:hypothetical protein